MKKLLFIVKPEMEFIYLDVEELDNSETTLEAHSAVIGRKRRSLYHFEGMSIGSYESILSHAQLKRLIEISKLLKNLTSPVESKKALLLEEAKGIASILESEQNNEFENRMLLNKMKNVLLEKTKNDFEGLNRKEIIEFCNYLKRKVFDYDVIYYIYKDLETFGKDKFHLLYNVDKDDVEYLAALEDHFDYKTWARELIEDEEAFFETSTGKVIEYNFHWFLDLN